MSGLTGLEMEALRLYGLPQEAIDEINAALPAAERMVILINQAQPMIDEALALFAKAQPIIAQANVELKTIMPAAMAVRAFLQARGTPSPIVSETALREATGTG